MDRMNPSPPSPEEGPEPQLPDDLLSLSDAWLADQLDEAGLADLEARLLADERARQAFVRYCQLHADLRLELRARKAGVRALQQLGGPEQASPTSPPRTIWTPFRWRAVQGCLAAAVLLLAVGAGWWLALLQGSEPIAWLVNAQDCRWSDEGPPRGALAPGTVLHIERGLVELGFGSGARVVLEGPAGLELLSNRSARLLQGRVVVTVPDAVTGFEILSPDGKVIDRGTEFGVAIQQSGATDVVVFQGKVDALGGNQPAVRLEENQAARIDRAGVNPHSAQLAGSFVRAIVLPPTIVPRSLSLDFRAPRPDSLLDGVGRGVGLTHRLPGTGRSLPARDPNMRLNLEKGHLELTTTRSDINRQFQLDGGEYPGVRLRDLGFTGDEDFEVTALLPDIPGLAVIGQFGLYAGTSSDRNIRGGLLGRQEPDSYRLFLVNNNGGRDSDSQFVGLSYRGDDLRMTLKRVQGRYAMTVENLTRGNSSTLTIRHPAWLDGPQDLQVGLFAALPRGEKQLPVHVKAFQATVFTRSSHSWIP